MSNGQQPNSQANVDINTPVMIVLPLGAWNTMLQMLSKNPWEQVNGIIVAVSQQLQRAQEQRQQQQPNAAPQPRAMIGDN